MKFSEERSLCKVIPEELATEIIVPRVYIGICQERLEIKKQEIPRIIADKYGVVVTTCVSNDIMRQGNARHRNRGGQKEPYANAVLAAPCTGLLAKH